MKCCNCPLARASYFANGDDYDCYCMVTNDYADMDEGSCKRTDKWILSQDVEKWINISADRTAKAVEEVTKFFLEEFH